MNHARIPALVALCAAIIVTLPACGFKKNLRANADARRLTFGVSVQAGDVFDPKAIKLIRENFNEIVPENAMKWRNIRPTKGFWNWSDMDGMVAFAEKNNIRMKGHVFLWHQQNPPYVDGLKTRDEALALMTDQISTIMARYKGRIYEYDVANEVLNDDGSMRGTVWYRTIGDDYLDIAFRTAHKADPAARLILNDYGNEYAGTPKGDAFYALVKGLVTRGAPISGVGLQLHVQAHDIVDESALRETIKRFRDLGLFVTFSEVDVRIAMPVTPEKEAEQVAAYTKLMEVALSEPNAASFVMWGYTDKLSWIPAFFPGYGSAHLFDRDVKPKAAYRAIEAMLAQREKESGQAANAEVRTGKKKA
ncbi:MAG TPA: endo-1,4-beta-xylanase [Treponemataceae bacterium]|nr:endo-1,4-beta-xylanase [Treponemataceae bacterium]HPS44213.1 endo-1,4-beta-xylanase [Treponemataceae bacterium]